MKINELVAQEWEEWVASRPPTVREMCRRWPPDTLYRLAPTGQLVTIYSYSENGTVTVYIDPEFNPRRLATRGFNVFGIDPEQLIPATNEDVERARRTL